MKQQGFSRVLKRSGESGRQRNHYKFSPGTGQKCFEFFPFKLAQLSQWQEPEWLSGRLSVGVENENMVRPQSLNSYNE